METRHSEAPGQRAKLDDRQLFSACWEREPGAWEEFLDRFGRLIYYSIHRTCSPRGYGLSPPDADDLFNDVLVSLIKDDCKKLRQYRGDGGATAATWIRTITVRYVIDYLRAKAQTGRVVDFENEGLADEISHTNPVPRPDEDYQESEKLRLFHAAVLALDKNDRYFIELYYTKEKSPEEVANILGISVKTVYTRVNRLKEKIQESISRDERK